MYESLRIGLKICSVVIPHPLECMQSGFPLALQKRASSQHVDNIN